MFAVTKPQFKPIIMKKLKFINVQVSKQVLSNFAIILVILQLIIIIAMGIFVRMNTAINTDALDLQRYLAFENINAMILIGFGYLMTALKTNNFSALVYTLFVNALSMQLYVLFQGFWSQIFSAFKKEFYIYVDQKLLIRGSYCVVSGLISLAAVIGRINPTEIIKMSIVHVAAYSFNQYLLYNVLGVYDAGGSTTVHVFGAYFGIAVSVVLAKYVRPASRPQKSYYSNVLAMVGTMFLWVYWPAFNFGVYANNAFERTQIIANTIFSLTGSTIATLIVTSMHGRGILMEDIQHASIVGGVAIGASAGILYLPPVALVIGFFAGIVSTNAFHYLSKKLEKWLKLFDFHGVHNSHGLPGIMGGIASAILIGIYSTGYDTNIAPLYSKDNTLLSPNTNFTSKAGLQLAAVGISFAISIISGFVAGKFIGLFYDEKVQDFYEDCTYFDHALFLNNEDKNIRYEEMEEIRKVPLISQREEVKKTYAYQKEREEGKKTNVYQKDREEVKKTNVYQKEREESRRPSASPPISSQRVTREQKSFRERERDLERERERERERELEREKSRGQPLQIQKKVTAKKSKRQIKVR